MIGKWHLTARGRDEPRLDARASGRSAAASSASTASWAPRPTSGIPTWSTTTTRSSSPSLPEEGYHLTTDLTDRALAFIRDAKAIAPDKPFFLYYCPGACHAPHHAPKEWADKYKGKFDMGYEAYRELVFERQKQLGIIPDGAELSPINPYVDETERRRQGLAGARHGAPVGLAVSDDEKRLFCRMAEVYAGFLSHADHEIGRLLDYLEESGAARQHDHRARLRQRRLRRGRTERLGQREQALQRPPRPDRGEPASSSTSSAARRPTTTTRPAGRARSTRRSSCGSATPTGRAAPPTR